MDTGEYETNALLINNISTIAFALYEPLPSQASSFGPAALDVENSLRNGGHLACYDPGQRGIWCFRILRKAGTSTGESAEPGFAPAVAVADIDLNKTEEGAFEPVSLIKGRMLGPNTPSSSSSSGSAIDTKPGYSQPAATPATQSLVSTTSADIETKSASATSETRPQLHALAKEAYEHFTSVVLSITSSRYCEKVGGVPLNSRTILLPKGLSGHNSSTDSATIAVLRMYLTTTGTLVITIALSSVNGLIRLSDTTRYQPLLPSAALLAAPFGVFAERQSIVDNDSLANDVNSVGSLNTQLSRPGPSKDVKLPPGTKACMSMLKTRGVHMSLISSSVWLSLHRMRRRPKTSNLDGKRTLAVGPLPTISWPSSLCFGKKVFPLTRPNLEQDYDPLSCAKNWFVLGSERDELLAKKKKERDTVVPRETASTESQVQTTTTYSPMDFRRPSNTGPAPSAMYPTPPDGVQIPVGATPSIDGNVSSPGQPNTITATVDTTAVNTTGETYGENWEGSTSKRERAGTGFTEENLFGDLGPDMFGDNDITDADFSFFDDDQPAELDIGSFDMPDAGPPEAIPPSLSFGDRPGNSPMKIDTPTPDRPESPVFAKPELKHARSVLSEEVRHKAGAETEKQPIGVKRPPSPFNPATVYKRVRASLENQKAVYRNSFLEPIHSGSIFDKVDFDPGLSMVNEKYEGKGRFDYSADQRKDSESSNTGMPPTTNYLRRHSKPHKRLRDLPSAMGSLFARLNGANEANSAHASPSKVDDLPSDADDVSLVSDQDDSSYTSDEPSSPMKAGSVQRQRQDEDTQSLATSFKDLDCTDPPSPSEALDILRFSKSDAPELALSRYFADPEPDSEMIPISDSEYVMAAQILTDQVISTTLPLDPTMTVGALVETRRELLNMTRQSVQELRSVLSGDLEELSECQFRPFIEVQDVPLIGQPTRMQPRPPGSEQMKQNNLFQIPSPHLALRRYESKLSVLPSAITFWESLGLGPSCGNKDINAIGVFPGFPGMSDNLESFLQRFKSTYESFKLGSFNRLPSTNDVINGLLQYDPEQSSDSPLEPAPFLPPSLTDQVGKLSRSLSGLKVDDTNFVVFFVYSSSEPRSIIEACFAFHQLFEKYKRLLAGQRMSATNELVLQLVPMEFLASTSHVVIPPPIDFARICLETYDRCTMFGGEMPAPAIMLEKPLPRGIDFKLTTTPSAALMRENTCLHIAYAQSADERWISAAWTDNRGSQQMTASYCLGRKGKALSTPFSEVAREIWDTTHDITSIYKVHWRVIITKCTSMEQHEIETWSALSQAESRASISLTLISVDTNPSLQLIPPAVKLPNNTPTTFYTTPVSTPAASIVSPEQTANPPTPMRDNAGAGAATPGGDNNATDPEGDATLVDVTEQTWGAVLSHRLGTSFSASDSSPALVSGYLVKRGGARLEDPPAVMEVNIVHSEGNPRAYEGLMREMLIYFRGLGTLARARGVVDRETDIRPWHIAAAEKGVRALYLLM